MPSKDKRNASEEVEEEEQELSDIELPDLDNPYTTLEVAEDATEDQIKKSYRKLSLKYHPDKAAPEDKQTATESFQKLTAAYALLSDPRRRARYDSTGDASESLLDDDDFNWSDFFREQFKESITQEKIINFAKTYKNSAEEHADVLKAYANKQVKGRMVALYERVMLSDMTEDEERFRKIIDDAITNLEAKYGAEKKGKKSKKRGQAGEPTDEEFEAIQAKLGRKK
ncbi:hypothetical protein FH972_021573 [Carpinus fangiana]|uniref:J domain-containing protein n=1 Tax=Carpinus fangiana TaxID=176857 RepID=A0A5N6KPN3_9ROSI|nr:hypothetical protein FH972_021573 [Carpinus fangiana]